MCLESVEGRAGLPGWQCKRHGARSGWQCDTLAKEGAPIEKRQGWQQQEHERAALLWRYTAEFYHSLQVQDEKYIGNKQQRIALLFAAGSNLEAACKQASLPKVPVDRCLARHLQLDKSCFNLLT